MTFNDIFTSNFLDNFTSVSILDMVIALVLALCIGVFIFFIYKKTFTGVMYSSSFSVTLVALTMISTLVILAVSSNVVLSLGMVGALSIVRFRTAIKEPLDIAFLFWAIAAGIVLAAGMIPLAILGSLVIGGMLLVFVNRKTNDKPYLLVLTCTDETVESQAHQLISEGVVKSAIKGKTVNDSSIELNYEVRLRKEDTTFLGSLKALAGMRQVILVSYNGDYLG
ncbi:MAG: DUF4956 domain-containing protein [Coriobacteriales bacterium]|jgi:uncharacterized membrane protein YhiD involved in acid resistance|nr:DUF4956 domain-containing protein [Coriobacteriales bacterium]